MILFVIFIFAIGLIMGNMNGYPIEFILIALIFSIVMNLVGYFKGDAIALRMSGAKQITKEENPYVYRMVENLCLTAGLPIPKVHIIDDQAMNAFATGRSPEHASIALTKGIIERLKNEELEGVIAHELAHIKNYDIRLMTIVIVLVGMIVILADIFLRSRFLFGGGGESRNKNPIFIVIGLLFIILSPIFAQLIQLAISRKREFLADASGALLTRYPEGLASALEKISADTTQLQRTSTATAHLFISNPFQNGKRKISNFFSTHPPIEERIKKLRKVI